MQKAEIGTNNKFWVIQVSSPTALLNSFLSGLSPPSYFLVLVDTRVIKAKVTAITKATMQYAILRFVL